MKAKDEQTVRDRVYRMWSELIRFVQARPLEFLYLEYGSAGQILTDEQKEIVTGYSLEIRDMLQDGIDTGKLAPIDVDLILMLLISPGIQYAREAAQSGLTVDTKLTDVLFERVWLSIKN